MDVRTVVSGGPACKGRSPVVLDTKRVDGVEFFRATTTDPKLVRLISGKAPSGTRPLSGYNMFSCIASLRDAAVDRIINPPAADDLMDDGGDARPRKLAKRIKHRFDVPDVVYVTLPGVGDSQGISCKALSTGALYVELTTAVLDYMTSYAVHVVGGGDGCRDAEVGVDDDEVVL